MMPRLECHTPPRLDGVKLMLSIYRLPLYDSLLATWNRHEFDLPNNAAGESEKRRMTEIVYYNF